MSRFLLLAWVALLPHGPQLHRPVHKSRPAGHHCGRARLHPWRLTDLF